MVSVVMADYGFAIDGAGSYYRPSGSNPLLLESVFNDPSLRKTNFVFVHGGAPFTKQVQSLMGKSNVYADFSAQTFFFYPRALSQNLRDWLESYPDRVLYGTDALGGVVNLISGLGIRRAIQELLNPRMRTFFQFLRRPCRNDVAVVEYDDSIRDLERARQFVRDHNNRDSEGLLQIQNQLVDPCSDDGIKSR